MLFIYYVQVPAMLVGFVLFPKTCSSKNDSVFIVSVTLVPEDFPKVGVNVPPVVALVLKIPSKVTGITEFDVVHEVTVTTPVEVEVCI